MGNLPFTDRHFDTIIRCIPIILVRGIILGNLVIESPCTSIRPYGGDVGNRQRDNRVANAPCNNIVLSTISSPARSIHFDVFTYRFFCIREVAVRSFNRKGKVIKVGCIIGEVQGFGTLQLKLKDILIVCESKRSFACGRAQEILLRSLIPVPFIIQFPDLGACNIQFFIKTRARFVYNDLNFILGIVVNNRGRRAFRDLLRQSVHISALLVIHQVFKSHIALGVVRCRCGRAVSTVLLLLFQNEGKRTGGQRLITVQAFPAFQRKRHFVVGVGKGEIGGLCGICSAVIRLRVRLIQRDLFLSHCQISRFRVKLHLHMNAIFLLVIGDSTIVTRDFAQGIIVISRSGILDFKMDVPVRRRGRVCKRCTAFHRHTVLLDLLQRELKFGSSRPFIRSRTKQLFFTIQFNGGFALYIPCGHVRISQIFVVRHLQRHRIGSGITACRQSRPIDRRNICNLERAVARVRAKGVHFLSLVPLAIGVFHISSVRAHFDLDIIHRIGDVISHRHSIGQGSVIQVHPRQRIVDCDGPLDYLFALRLRVGSSFLIQRLCLVADHNIRGIFVSCTAFPIPHNLIRQRSGTHHTGIIEDVVAAALQGADVQGNAVVFEIFWLHRESLDQFVFAFVTIIAVQFESGSDELKAGAHGVGQCDVGSLFVSVQRNAEGNGAVIVDLSRGIAINIGSVFRQISLISRDYAVFVIDRDLVARAGEGQGLLLFLIQSLLIQGAVPAEKAFNITGVAVQEVLQITEFDPPAAILGLYDIIVPDRSRAADFLDFAVIHRSQRKGFREIHKQGGFPVDLVAFGVVQRIFQLNRKYIANTELVISKVNLLIAYTIDPFHRASHFQEVQRLLHRFVS